MFERLDPDRTKSPLEVRYPYLDLRLLRFLLAVPAMPWCRNKLLMRLWGKGRLPAATLGRRKTTLHAYPGFAQTGGRVGAASAKRAALLAHFVDPAHVQASSTYSEFEYTMAKRPSDLAWWLEYATGLDDGLVSA
jgi:asparagine synthase (glutamine-hydrolysing)